MRGLILNVADERLPSGSPWRTRWEVRHHPALFVLDDGTPVFEAWFWDDATARWFCMSRGYDAQAARAGVIYFDSIEQLRAQLASLGRRAA
jgi:hypothetical protein